MRFKTGQTISIDDIQGNGKNILSLVASIFSHIRYIRYLICLDWFRLLECAFAFHMGRRFWHSLRCVFAKHFYHILLGFFFCGPFSVVWYAVEFGSLALLSCTQNSRARILHTTHTHAGFSIPTTMYALLNSAVNSYCLFSSSIVDYVVAGMAKWRNGAHKPISVPFIHTWYCWDMSISRENGKPIKVDSDSFDRQTVSVCAELWQYIEPLNLVRLCLSRYPLPSYIGCVLVDVCLCLSIACYFVCVLNFIVQKYKIGDRELKFRIQIV